MIADERPEALPMDLATFFQSSPPGMQVNIPAFEFTYVGTVTYISLPQIQLHCNDSGCDGIRFFDAKRSTISASLEWNKTFVDYVCRNCGRQMKTYAIFHKLTTSPSGAAYKIGEYPLFGPPLPSRVSKLIGSDRDLFSRGRRAESQGLGIGAFAYYRRLVERQWQRIIGEIVKVAEKVEASPETISTLRAAAKETQFSKAVETASDAIPATLRIEGRNPLTLLYKALSEGLHDGSEEHCLQLAGAIRLVLTELAERISAVLSEQRELHDAVSKLLQRDQEGLATGGEPVSE